MPTLREGSRGADVVTLQNALNICLQHEDADDPDRLQPAGGFGSRTTARVRALQGLATPWFGRIEVDGVCGPVTWKKVGYILTGSGREV
jgi:peptidoglycan hydrolase-like protein with peptidoglycan-binding domain